MSSLISLREVNIPNLNPLLFLKKLLASYGRFAVFFLGLSGKDNKTEVESVQLGKTLDLNL